VFFFKAWYQDGEVEPNKDDVTDFKWVTMDQLSQFCSKQYLNSVSEFLVDL
jgi:isopentenyldiphosphate isomerase